MKGTLNLYMNEFHTWLSQKTSTSTDNNGNLEIACFCDYDGKDSFIFQTLHSDLNLSKFYYCIASIDCYNCFPVSNAALVTPTWWTSFRFSELLRVLGFLFRLPYLLCFVDFVVQDIFMHDEYCLPQYCHESIDLLQPSAFDNFHLLHSSTRPLKVQPCSNLVHNLGIIELYFSWRSEL